MLEYRDAVAAVRAVAAARGVSDSDGVRAIARALLRPDVWAADKVGMTAYLDIEFDSLAPVEGAASTDTGEAARPPSPSPVTLQSALRALAGALDEAEDRFGDTRVADRLIPSVADRLAGNRDADEALVSVLFEIREGAPAWTSFGINGLLR